MICQKCGTSNVDESKFCIKCGSSLGGDLQSEFLSNNDNNDNHLVNDVQSVNSFSTSNHGKLNSSGQQLNFLMYFVAILMRPFKSFREEENKLSNIKTSILLGVVVAGLMTLITMIKSIIGVVITKTLDYSTFDYKTVIDFSKIKNLNWVNLVFRNFLMYVVIVSMIAFVYYVIGLILKKKVNFIKMLSITASSLIPLIVINMFLSTILGLIWSPLSMIVGITGIIYTLLIFLNLMDEELSFDTIDSKIYFHLLSLSVICSSIYFIYLKIIMGM